MQPKKTSITLNMLFMKGGYFNPLKYQTFLSYLKLGIGIAAAAAAIGIGSYKNPHAFGEKLSCQ